MKSVSSLLFATLLFSVPMANAMEPRDFGLEETPLEQRSPAENIIRFMYGLSRDAQIETAARFIADLQNQAEKTKADDLEIAAAAIEFLVQGNPRNLTDTERAQLASIAQSVDTYLEQNAAIAQSPNGGWLAAASAQLESFIVPEPEKPEEDDKAQAALEEEEEEEELDTTALGLKLMADQKRLEADFKARMKQVGVKLAGFAEANPGLAELPDRLAGAQAKLLEHAFKGKQLSSLDALRKKNMLAGAQIFEKHAKQDEPVDQLALGFELLQSTIEISAQELNKVMPPVKASAKQAARVWAHADWASVLPGLYQAGNSFLACLNTVASNYEAEVVKAERLEAKKEKAAAQEAARAEAAQAEAALQVMLAALGTTSDTGTNLELP